MPTCQDTLVGGRGADTLEGGAGNDWFFGNPVETTSIRLNSNFEDAEFVFDNRFAQAEIGPDDTTRRRLVLTSEGADSFDRVRAFDFIFDDFVYTRDDFRRDYGLAQMYSPYESYRGGVADNTYWGSNHRTDRAFGDDGDDTLDGFGGFDQLYGEAGQDVLSGGHWK